jgi:hypothetical protein
MRDKSVAAGRGPANLSLPFCPGGCHKTRMDKHSRAFSRPGKGKSKRLSTVGRRRISRRQAVPDQWVELATDAIRDGHTTVDSFVALFHPEVRFTAFRAYIAAMVTFTANAICQILWPAPNRSFSKTRLATQFAPQRSNAEQSQTK